MKKKTISIRGAIGKFAYNGKDISGVQLVDVIAATESMDADVKILEVEVGSMGGHVAVAKAIRAHLKSIQPRIEVHTKQVGDIGSSGTIIWSAGSKRIAAKGINPETGKPFEFMVHNPWVMHTEGNADELNKTADELRMTEDEMIAIYTEDTGISREAIQPLMKAETFFTTQNALDLKFATESYEALNQAAYKPMATKPKKGVLESLLALFTDEKDKAKIKSILAVAPPAALMGTAVLVNGVAAPDGVYTVVGGVVTALADANNPDVDNTDDDNDAPADVAPQAANKKQLDEILALVKAKPDAAALAVSISEIVDKKFVELKKSITSPHTPAGFDPSTSAADAKEWDRSFRANEHVAMKKNNPDQYAKLFYAKYGKMPNK